MYGITMAGSLLLSVVLMSVYEVAYGTHSVTVFCGGEGVGPTTDCMINENAGTVLVWVRFSNGDTGGFEYAMGVAESRDNTAIANVDYAGFEEAAPILPPFSSAFYVQIPITIIDDTDVEGDESFFIDGRLYLTTSAGGAGQLLTTANIIIVDDDPTGLPTVNFEKAVYVVDEGNTEMANIVRGDDGAAGTVAVSVTTKPLTARDTDDFTLDMTMVNVANDAISPITVTGVTDTVIEGVEVFILCIADNAAYNIGQTSFTTIYIRDPPATVLPTVTLEEAVYVVDEGSTDMVNVVRGDDGGAGTIAVGVTTKLLTARDTDDFTLDTTSVNVANDAMSPITVTGVTDTVIEGVEVFIVCITDNAAYNIGQPSFATVYIKDPLVLPTVSFDEAVYVVDEGSTGTVNIVRGDDGGAGTINVGVDITDLTTRETGDFTLDVSTVAVANFDMEAIMVSAVAELKVEGEGVEVFLLSIPDNAAYIVGKPSIATVYIKDPPVLPTVTFEEAVYVINEAGTVSVNILRGDDGGAGTVSVDVDITPLTARETDDFSLDVQTVAVANCDMEPIVVSGIADLKVEAQGIEAFLLSIPDNAAYIVGKPSIATIYIKDPPVLPTVTFEEAVYVVNEGGTIIVNILRADDGGAGTVNVDVDITVLTARETDDYTLDVQTVAVANCDMESIVVSAVADLKIEAQGIEAFLLSIPDNAAYIVGKPSIATIYIKDPPSLPVVTFEEAVYVVDEGFTVTVNLLRGDDGGITPINVGVDIYPLTATEIDDFALDVQTVAVANCDMEPLVVSAVADLKVEGHGIEVFLLTIPDNAAYIVGKPSIATIYIRDPPAIPTVAFDEAVYVVIEGDTVMVNILRGADGGITPITVGVEITLLNAANEDFTLDVEMVSVDNCGVQTITISGLSDILKEDLELFLVSIVENAAVYNIGMHSRATVYIIDVEPPLYSIEFCEYKAVEDQSPFTFNIIRSLAGSEGTIAFTVRDVSTTTRDDHQAVTRMMLTFPVNSVTEEGTVTLITDSSIEDTEVFEITLYGPTDGDLGEITKATVYLYDPPSEFFTN
ncbi:uncharacterized protein [Amphiura filiformis]|uniref:uncharacterized protein n=1 Tax=Amphiura filiformis TaxID=82378 RepID=UPI003B224438